MTPEEALHETFGLAEFRPGQAELIDAQLAGRDVLGVAPTGSGKSLSYWIPAVVGEGLTVVVSPLIALMKDQVDRLTTLGIPAAFINSTLGRADQQERLRVARVGGFKLLYLAPERLSRPGFADRLAEARVARFIVDEAHCISSWGHDFRPDYRVLGTALKTLGNPPVGAFTATATPLVRKDIADSLGLRDPLVQVTGFNRPNLLLEVVRTRGEREKLDALHARLRPGSGRALVYCGTVAGAEELAGELEGAGLRAAPYHGRLPEEARRNTQEAFSDDRLEVVVATSAFGMGVDVPDIRRVIHYQVPGSLEAYYQEAGRAGRDGLESTCTLLWSPADRELQTYFIERGFPETRDVLAVHGAYRRLGTWSAGLDEVRPLLPDSAWRALDACRSLLDKAGALEPDGSVSPFDPRRVDLDLLAEQKKHAYGRLAAVTGYAAIRTCRHAQIADYFGEEGVPRRCGACDNCRAAERPAAPAVGNDALQAALAGANRFSGRIGMVNLAAILAGKDVKWTREQAWVRETPAFGALSGWSDARLRDLLQELLVAGCLGQTPGQYPLTTITPLGREVLAGTARVEISLPGVELPSRSASSRPAGAGADPELFEKLRRWRTETAKAEGMPPYVIFHDRTLAELAGRPIRNLADLAAVPGLGPAKLEKYGGRLLELLSS